MQLLQTIFVTGATGNQGGAVARNLITKGFTVKALTRKASSDKAKKLTSLNIDVVEGDLDDPGTFRHYLDDVDGLFSVHDYSQGTQKEIKQGIALADAAKAAGIGHIVYSSVIGADEKTGIPHWESKNVIEQHVKSTGLSHTILRPASLYENYLIPQVRSRLMKGKLASPVNRGAIQQFISSEDVGKIASSVFMNPDVYNGKTITIAAEQMTLDEAAAIFTKTLGRPIQYQKVPGLIARLIMGRDLYKMFDYINKNDAVFLKDLAGFRKEHPHMMGLEQWIRLCFK